jgi:hypothetical protein
MTLISQHFHVRIEADLEYGVITLTQDTGIGEKEEINLNPDQIDSIIDSLRLAQSELREHLPEEG